MKLALFVIIIGLSINAQGQHANYDTLNFEKADSIAELYTGYDLRNKFELAEFLTKDLVSEAEKFRALFRWVAVNISYDTRMYNLSLGKGK